MPDFVKNGSDEQIDTLKTPSLEKEVTSIVAETIEEEMSDEDKIIEHAPELRTNNESKTSQ